MTKESDKTKDNEKDLTYILNYLLLWITGVLVYLTKGNDKRMKFHAVQAILLGVLSAILSIIFNILLLPVVSLVSSTVVWLLGMYIGFMAYNGKDITIPFVSKFAESHSGYDSESNNKKKKQVSSDDDSEKSDDAVETLKLRFAKGEITKEKYQEMKKALEG